MPNVSEERSEKILEARAGELTPLFVACRFRKLVEYVEVSLILDLPNHTTLFKKVVCNSGSDRFSVVIEHDFEVFTLPIRDISRDAHTQKSRNAHDD